MADGNGKPDDQTTNAPTIDVSSDEFKAAVATQVAEATAGLKQNRDDLLAEKRDIKEKHDALATTLTELGDLDALKTLADRFKNDEEAKLITEGKFDEVLNRRTDSMRKDAETRITKAGEKVGELEGLLVAANVTIATLVIDTKVSDAAAKLECAPTALTDIQRAAREVFSITEENELEARDKDSVLLLGPDGKAPLTPAAWLEQQKKAAPHWWGASAGGGAGGGVGVKGKGALSDKRIEGMSGTQKIAAALSGSS